VTKIFFTPFKLGPVGSRSQDFSKVKSEVTI